MRWLTLLLFFVVPLHAAEDEPVIKLAKSKVKDTAKPFTLMVTAKIKDGGMAKLEAAFAPCGKATRKEAGCLQYDLHVDSDKPDTIVLIERWKSVAALESHLKQAHTQTFLKTVPDWASDKPDLKILLPVE